MKFLVDNEHFTGLEVSTADNLMTSFIGEVLTLFMSVLMKSVLKIYYLYATKSEEELSKIEEEMNEKKKNEGLTGVVNVKFKDRARLLHIYKEFLCQPLLRKK